MTLSQIAKSGLTLALLVPAVFGPHPASQAQPSNPSGMNEQQGATTGLGASHRFRTAAAAADHCPGDTVVWLSGRKLVYDLPAAAGYGKGTGQYACRMEAEDAGFHNAGS